MIYAAFIVWFVLMLFAGVGVYRVWAGMVRGAWVNWVLLPGTIVSEMAYIFGCLITGGEIRHAKLLDVPGKGDGEPKTDAAPGIKFVGPVLASLLSIVACGAAILLAWRLLGSPVMGQFLEPSHAWYDVDPLSARTTASQALPQRLPTNWDEFWRQLAGQLVLLRAMFDALRRVDWLTWTSPLFVYLAACLSVRLCPVARPMRPTLAAVVLIAAVVGLLGLVWKEFAGLLNEVWPLLTYVWANLLLLLTLTLVVRGLIGLGRVLAGKETSSGKRISRTPKKAEAGGQK